MTKKIKVVHIIPTLGLGGAERVLVDLVVHGNRDLYDFSVITIIDGGPLENELRAAGIPYYALKKDALFGVGMLAQLTQLLNRLDPDIVHTHLFGAHLWGLVASMLNRVPILVASEQNTDVDLGELRTRIKQALSYSADAVVAASDAIKQFLITEGHIPEEKITVIRNAIDTRKYVELPEPALNEPLRLLVIGRLWRQKGHDVLIDALSRLHSVSWELSILGSGDLLSDLVDQVTLHHLNDRVHFLGTTTDVPSVLEAHDILLVPSRWEGIGLVVMEGMAGARPVIASNVGGIPEIIQHGSTGLLVEPENSQGIIDAIEWVATHTDSARTMARNARRFAIERCDISQMIEQYEALYARLTRQ